MRTLFAAAACFAALVFASAAAARDVSMPLRVNAGDQFTVTVTDRTTMQLGEQTVAMQTGSVWALTVVSTGAEARWRWTPISVTMTEFPRLPTTAGGRQGAPDQAALSRFDAVAMSEGMSALLRIVADAGFECRIDATGRCEALSNWPLWRARYENTALMVDAFARMAESAPKPAQAQAQAPSNSQPKPAPSFNWGQNREPILRALAAVIDGVDERSAALAVAGLHPLAAVQGRNLTVGQATPFVEEWPMPFGSPPLRVTGTLALERVRGDVALVRREAALEAESARAAATATTRYVFDRIVSPIMAASPPKTGESPPDPAALRAIAEGLAGLMQVSYSERTRGEVDLQTGLARLTTTDYQWRFAMPNFGSQQGSGAKNVQAPVRGGAPQAITGSGSYVIRVTRGAPAAPALPRAASASGG